jgi:glutathione S-transferase
MTLEEKGITYHLIEENLSKFSKELLVHHPEGKVPLLLHKDHALYESSIITEYLNEAFPLPELMPRSASSRADVRLLTYWCNVIFKADLDLFKYGWKSLTAEARTELQERLRKHLNKLVSRLGEQPFLMGAEMTLADIHLFPFYRQLVRAKVESIGIELPVTLSLWFERIASRPSFVRAMERKV